IYDNFFFQAEDGIRDFHVTGVQTCALPICQTEESVTEEEVRTIIAEATTAGVLETEEHSMISGVMRLADRSARGLMTPRPDVAEIGRASYREREDAPRIV